MQDIAHACVSSELSSLKLRLNLWRVFLNVIPFADEELIREKMNNARLYYGMEYENFKPNKNIKDDPLISNPLSRNVNVLNLFNKLSLLKRYFRVHGKASSRIRSSGTKSRKMLRERKKSWFI